MTGIPETQMMGCLPIDTAPGDGEFPVMGEGHIERDRDKWKDRMGQGLIRPHVFNIPRQQFNNCAVEAAKGCAEIVRHQRDGDTTVLSETFTYRLVNGGRDAGSTIQGNLKALVDVGTVPDSVYPKNTWRRRHTEEELELAKSYQVREWLECPDFDAHATSILWYSKPTCFGVRWGYAGHAIVGIDISTRDRLPAGVLPAWDEYVTWLEDLQVWDQAEACGRAGSDTFWTKIKNSWGTGYGEEGFGWLPESQVASGIRARYGCWAALTMAQAG